MANVVKNWKESANLDPGCMEFEARPLLGNEDTYTVSLVIKDSEGETISEACHIFDARDRNAVPYLKMLLDLCQQQISSFGSG